MISPFEHELEGSQRRSVRITCLVAAPILLAFSALDAVVVPGHWGLLLGLRLGAGIAFLLLAALLGRHRISPFCALLVVLALVMVPIEAGVMLSGGAASPYVYAAMLPMAGAPLLVPLRPGQAAVICALIAAAVYVPILAAGTVADLETFATGASYLACMAVLTVIGAAVRERGFRREHETRLRAARQVGLANLGMLAGGLGHELSSPLVSMALGVEQLKDDPELATRGGKALERIDRAVQRMKNILDAMRSGTQVAGQRFGDVDLAQEIEQALLLINDRLRAGVELRRELQAIPPVRAERTLIGQVLVNLLINAVHAVEERPSPRVVVVRLRQDDGLAMVEVEDNGAGVPPELRDRIFQPLFTTKGDAGTGFGLWLSAEIARTHDGSLTVHKGAEGGALFRLSIPTNEPGA